MIAVLCPLKSEFIVAQKVLESESCIVALGGHGKVNFAVRATELILKNPELTTLICLGVGGALTSEVKPLDVVVGSMTVEHDYIEKFNPSEHLPQIKSAPSFIDPLKKHKFSGFNLHIGTIASGDEDIISKNRVHEIHEKTGALAVGWEGMGGAKACRLLERKFLEVRGITDVCEENTLEEFLKNLDQAMVNASEVIQFLLNT